MTDDMLNQALPITAGGDKGFGVMVTSEQGRNDVDVQRTYESNQPAKQLAELTVLECGFLDWARQERMRLTRAAMLGQP